MILTWIYLSAAAKRGYGRKKMEDLNELKSLLELLEKDLEEAQEAYEMPENRKYNKKLYGKIKNMEERISLLKLHIAAEECREFEH